MKRVINNLKDNKIYVLMVAIVLLPILVYSIHSIPAADDYSNAVAISAYWNTYSNSFFAALMRDVDLYKSLGGYYFASFLNVFFVPFLRFGITGLRVFNFIVNGFFAVSLYYFVDKFACDLLKTKKNITWLIFAIIETMLVNTYMNTEIYTWYCVLVAYILPMSLMLIAFGKYFSFVMGKTKRFISISVIAFLVSGSSLNIVALNCLFYLILGVYGFVYFKKKKESIIIFCSSFLGALVNVVAPGNFARRDTISENYNIFASVKDDILLTVDSCISLFTSPVFIISFVIILITILNTVDFADLKIDFKYPIIALVCVPTGVLIVNFPVVFGYGTEWTTDRCIFVQNLTLTILMLLWTVYFAGFINKRMGEIQFDNKSKIVLCLVFSLSLCNFFNCKGGMDNFTTTYMWKHIMSGRMEEFVNYEEGIISAMENSKNEDVIFPLPQFSKDIFVKDIGIQEDPDWWVNDAVSRFYGLKSLKYEKQE